MKSRKITFRKAFSHPIAARSLAMLFSAGMLALSAQAGSAADWKAPPHSPAPAHEPDLGTFTANVALTSDYVFRGISQSNEDPAVQGGFDWNLGVFYAGVWASSIEFNVAAPTEIDLYAGLTKTFGDTTFSIGGIYYLYPGAADPNPGEFNYFEVAGAVEHDFKFAKLKGAVNYSPDYFGESGDAVFIEGKLTVPLPHSFEVSGALGHQWIENNTRFGTPDYLTWNAGLSWSWKKFTLDGRYHDTDLTTAECFGGPPKLCGARFVGTISASF